jgi:flagellar protein FlbT
VAAATAWGDGGGNSDRTRNGGSVRAAAYNAARQSKGSPMTLRISLRNGEKVIVNGAVVRAVGRAALCIESKAAILRGRDVMAADDATTPARRLYLACMSAYIDADRSSVHQETVLATLTEVMQAMVTTEAAAACAGFALHLAAGDHYRALADCRTLMAMEKRDPPQHPAPPPAESQHAA